MSFMFSEVHTSGWNTVFAFGAGLLLLWLAQSLVKKFLALRVAYKAVEAVPGGELIWLHPFRSMAPVLAPFFPFKDRIGNYYSNYDVYQKYGSTILGSVKFWGSTPTFWISDADALRTVSNNRSVFRRDIEGYEVVSVYGPNMVATEGDAWKRYRSVAKPAFNEANNRLVWQHATRVVNEWFNAIDSQGFQNKPTLVELLKDCTEATLLILSSAAFGRHNAWSDHAGGDSSNTVHRIPFRPAVTSAVDNLVPKILTPDWVFKLAEYLPMPKIVKETQHSFIFLRLHMLDLINMARDWISGGNNDDSLDAALLQNLVKANLAQQHEEKDLLKRRLTDEELLSNTFMFLLAGHETSAHSLCFAITLMALYPDVQEKMYKEVKRLWPELDGIPNAETVNSAGYKDDMANLEYITAAFREALRLFPPVPRLASPVHTSTAVTSRLFSTDNRSNMQSTVNQVNIPAGSLAVIDIIGLHRNPLHWGEDIDQFKPERFIDTDSYTWPRDAFLAFSAGPRSCLGERFAMVESVCMLAHVARRYEVTVPEHLIGRSLAEQKKALLEWVPRMTLIPMTASVCFTPRAD